MKQYTTPEQTAKLIKLGFEKPKSRIDGEVEEILKVIVPLGEFKIPISKNLPAYSIGELIEILPTDNNIGWNIRKHNSITDISKTQYSVIVDVNMFLSAYTTESEELFDALFNMIVKLKEEGVI